MFDNNMEEEWNRRSLLLKDSLKSVMFSSFPDYINNIFHEWEMSILKKYFPKSPKKISVLDIGCGFGRLSFPLSREFNNAKFYGVDVSKEYVRFYNSKLKDKGKATVAKINDFDFEDQKFNFIFIVTVLMYLSKKEIIDLSKKIKKITDQDAVVVVIENNSSGVNYISGFGLLNFIKRLIRKENKYNIRAQVFKENEIENYFNNDFDLHYKIRCSLLTFFLPLFFICSKFKMVNLIKTNLQLDFPFLPSLYTAYIFKKKNYE